MRLSRLVMIPITVAAIAGAGAILTGNAALSGSISMVIVVLQFALLAALVVDERRRKATQRPS